MTSIRKTLSQDPLAVADIDLKRRESLTRFSGYLPDGVEPHWTLVLHRFVNSAPWRYWDPEVVDSSLEILERSVERTFDSLTAWSRRINIGFDNLFKLSPTYEYEEALNWGNPSELLRLATEFHPEYLRCAEHIFANLLSLYWAVLKRGTVQANYSLKSAISLIENRGCNFLILGYDERVRNGIAHGEIVFKGRGYIQYGPDTANYELWGVDFLNIFDVLRRTSNALAIALLLFVARNRPRTIDDEPPVLPPSIVSFIASAGVERPGLKVLGVVESELESTNKQLHIAIQTEFRSRVTVLADSARLAMHLIDNGASGYSRYLLEIDQGEQVSSLAIILPMKLEELLKQEASFDRLGEIFDEMQLLWYDESKFRHRLRSYKLIIASHLRLAIANVQSEWQNLGLKRGAGRYRIRKIENRSVKGIPRIHVIAVLKNPKDADDRDLIREISRAIIKRVSRKLIRTNPSRIEKRWGRFSCPKYIWVSLYKVDGTLRWLDSGGWSGGNLVAIAEKIKGLKKLPVFVRNPEEIWKNIRFRFGMNAVS